jgi:hypothetical protein
VRWVLLLAVCGCGRVGFDPHPPDVGAAPIVPACDVTNPDLVACWSLDDTLADDSAAGLDAVATGPLLFVPGIRGRALQLDPITAVTLPESPLLDLVPALTLEMWIRLSLGNDAFLFDNDAQYALWHESSSFAGTIITAASGGQDVGGGTVRLGEWQHVAIVFDGANVALFVDGLEVDRRAAQGSANTSGTTGSRIGANANENNLSSTGAFDEIRIWRTARTAAEICAAASCSN